MKFDFKKFFGFLGRGALKVADVGAAAGIPVLTQIDKVADAVKEIKVTKKADKEAVDKIITDLVELKNAVPKETPTFKGMLESNRFKATMIGLVVALGAHIGLPAEVATQIAEVAFYFIATYVTADTLRRSTK